MKSKILILITLLVSSFSFGQYQQYINMVTPYLNDSIKSGFFQFTTPNNFQPGFLYESYRQSAPDLNNNMVLIDSHVDSLVGFTHHKYQQTYMDIPIEGAGCIEHFDTNGSLSFINAKVADSIKKSHEPKLNKEEALKLLFEQIKGKEKVVFAWEDEDWEKQIKLDTDNENATWFPEPELIWAVDTMKNMKMIIPGDRFTLAYKISVKTITPQLETAQYYVDANNGAILKIRSSHIHDGPAGVYGYGLRMIDTRWKGGFTSAYILETNDATRKIHTKKSPNENSAWSILSEVKDDYDLWGNTYLTETSTHYHVSNSWDYFKNVFGRIGMNGGSAAIKVRTQINKADAYFNGSNGFPELVFGKSSGWDWGMEPSIVAHEFTHGVTSSSSDLQYEYESGALNESFSDIFGVVIQAVMLDGGSTDWIIGNHVPTAPMRSLKDPKSRGSHWLGTYYPNGQPKYGLGQPDTYEGDNWCSSCPFNIDNGGVHINSGVQNKWFFVLAYGDSNVNDLSNYYDVDGIGMTKAARISYYALTSILMNSSQYSDSRQATINAAKTLYGECSVEHQNTIDAWYAVGIGAMHNCEYTLSSEDIIGLNETVLIYPNPTSNRLTIEVPNKVNNEIKIFDATGKLVESFVNTNLVINKDVSHLGSGVYFINFTINDNPVRKRFIIQK